jgi:hypothetical protein
MYRLFTIVGVFKRGVVINILLSLAVRLHLGKEHGGFTIQGGGGTSHKEVVVNIFPRVLMKRLASFTCTNSSWLGLGPGYGGGGRLLRRRWPADGG